MKTPFRLIPLFIAGLSLTAAHLGAQTDQDDPDAAPAVAGIPADINGNRNVFPAPVSTKPFRLAIYQGQGSNNAGIANVTARAKQVPGTTVTLLTGEQIAAGELTTAKFDAVAFTGGTSRKQGAGLGDAGRANVTKFVGDGGGYLGICAGAYLATGYPWGLNIIDAKTVSPKWMRGKGFLDLEVAEDGKPITGDVKGVFKCRYANGPILEPAGLDHIPDYKVAAWFRSEIAKNGTPEGIQINSPAALYGNFGKGRVFLISPHPENTPGLENFVPRALLWVTAR